MILTRLIAAWHLIWSKHFVLITGKPTGIGITFDITTVASRDPIRHQAFFIGAQVLIGHAGAATPSPVVDPDIEKMLKKVEST